MKKIHITESQLVELCKLNEMEMSTTDSSTQTNGTSSTSTDTTSGGETSVVKNNDGLTATKNSDGTGTITVPQDKVGDRSGIKDIAMQSGVDPNKTNIITDKDGNGDISNTVAFMGTKQDFMNTSRNQSQTMSAEKMAVQNPDNMAMAVPMNTLTRESTFVTSKKAIKESRRNYLIDNSLVTTKRDIKKFLNN